MGLNHKSQQREEISYIKPVITTKNSDAEDMLIIIKELQSFSTCSSRQSWLDINFPKTSNLKVSLNNTPADERFILLRLVKSPY